MPVMPVDTTWERLKAVLCEHLQLNGKEITDFYIQAEDSEDPDAVVEVRYEGTAYITLEEFQALLEEIKQ